MNTQIFRRHRLALAIAYASALTLSQGAIAQDAPDAAPPAPTTNDLPVIDELVITSRLKDAASQIAVERIEQPFAAEILGVDQIVRVGDSNVASALRRVTGLTLIGGKFIYVRGLGERYSSTTLNGANVPSPELSRNVIPLDLFPTTILSSLKVHKAYSPEQPAHFGGGSVDIRTRSVPDGPVFSVSAGSGWNSNNSDKGIEVYGGGGELPSAIKSAINTYNGNPEVNRILSRISPDGGTREDAEEINRQLAASLDRNLSFEEESLSPDIDFSIGAGNSWLVGNDFEIGLLANFEQKTKTRNENRTEQDWANPTTSYSDVQRTKESENTTYAVNFGVKYQDKHSISTNSYLLQNNDDESSISVGEDFNVSLADGRQKIEYESWYEERELTVNQIIGEHTIEDGDFGFVIIPGPFDALNVKWMYSLSEATTDIPSAANIDGFNYFDPVTLQPDGTSLGSTSSAAQFNFLDLSDEVEHYGMDFEAPFTLKNAYGSLTFGWQDSSKAREYDGYTANISTVGMSRTQLSGSPAQALSNANILNPDNLFSLRMGSEFGTESYVAAIMNEAVYGGFDIIFNDTWRFTAGVRWEQNEYGILPYDNLDFSGASIQDLIDGLQDPNQTYAAEDDDYYPSVAFTYIGSDFLGTETYQLRASYGATVVRPDLRERAPITYYDRVLGIRVEGNPTLLDADIDHFDLRAELYYSNGNSLTTSIFYKDIANPIETITQVAGDNQKLTYTNSATGFVYGIEFEGFVDIGSGFFLNGNMTLSDSETDFDGLLSQTNQQRRLTGHSKYVVNGQLGFDSDNGQHSASLVYNVFGERIFAGGINSNPDQFEQPFHSLDMVYFFYPTDSLSLKFSVENILGSNLEVDQGGTTVIEEERGTGFGLDVKYNF